METHVLEFVCLSPCTGYRMEFFHISCYKNCNVCLKIPKINDKRGRGWPILKRFQFSISLTFTLVIFSHYFGGFFAFIFKLRLLYDETRLK